MQRLTLFAAGVVAGIVLGAQLLPARAELSPPATLGTGAAFEYEIVTLKPVGRHPEELAELLDERGRQGWQLQTLTQVSDLAVFMRRR